MSIFNFQMITFTNALVHQWSYRKCSVPCFAIEHSPKKFQSAQRKSFPSQHISILCCLRSTADVVFKDQVRVAHPRISCFQVGDGMQ